MTFYHAYKVVFLCDITDGAPRPSDETADVDFFEFSGLPPLSAHRTNERHLTEIQAHLAQDNRRTAFD
jgi:hypothetical protein